MLLAAGADLALLAGLDLVQAVAEVADALVHEPAVLFELRFAGAAQADAALVAGQVAPHVPQPRKAVLELGQLDLHPGLGGAGSGGEDVEDQLAAVEYFDLGGGFQVAGLCGAEVVVEDDNVRVAGADQLGQLLELALADVGAGVDPVAALEQFADDRGSRGGRQPAQLIQRVGADPRAVRQRDADQHGLLAPDSELFTRDVNRHWVLSPSFPPQF